MERIKSRNVVSRLRKASAPAQLIVALCAGLAAGEAPPVDWDARSGSEKVNALAGFRAASEDIPVAAIVLVSAATEGSGAKKGVAVEGSGSVSGNGSLDKRPKGGPKGSIAVSGEIAVTGPGLAGTALVSGTINLKVEATPLKSVYKLSGCGKVRGDARFKEGKASVSGQVCVSGEAVAVKVPWFGERWIAHVSGVAKVAGTMQRKG